MTLLPPPYEFLGGENPFGATFDFESATPTAASPSNGFFGTDFEPEVSYHAVAPPPEELSLDVCGPHSFSTPLTGGVGCAKEPTAAVAAGEHRPASLQGAAAYSFHPKPRVRTRPQSYDEALQHDVSESFIAELERFGVGPSSYSPMPRVLPSQSVQSERSPRNSAIEEHRVAQGPARGRGAASGRGRGNSGRSSGRPHPVRLNSMNGLSLSLSRKSRQTVGPPVLDGMLHIANQRSFNGDPVWQRRWVVLLPPELVIYDGDTASSTLGPRLGAIRLEAAGVRLAKPEDALGFETVTSLVLEPSNTDVSTHYLCCDDSSDSELWAETLILAAVGCCAQPGDEWKAFENRVFQAMAEAGDARVARTARLKALIASCQKWLDEDAR